MAAPATLTATLAATRARLRHEAAGAVALAVAAVVALVWANSPARAAYDALWTTGLPLGLDLRHWVGDGLMAVFFFSVGLEVKRELVHGELRDPRVAALPALAAVGGMAVPALLYTGITRGTDGTAGWGIPVATDIVFAVGALGLLGSRVPRQLTLFLLTLAVVDDIGAIAVIALFYGKGLHLAWGAAAIAALGAGWLVQRCTRSWAAGPALVALAPVGAIAWYAAHESGVHATIAGVALGLLAPAVAADRLEHALAPVVGLAIVPLFALANAGVALRAGVIGDADTARVALGAGLGLVVGKVVGVSGSVWLAVRLRVVPLPEGLGARHVLGGAAMAGIGFTVSLFIAGLAFGGPHAEALVEAAKVGVLAGSLVAAGCGTALLRRS